MSKSDEELGRGLRSAIDGEKVAKLLIRIALVTAILVLLGWLFILAVN